MWIVSFYTAANKQIALFSSYFKYFPCVYVTERKLHLCVSKSNVKVYMLKCKNKNIIKKS